MFITVFFFASLATQFFHFFILITAAKMLISLSLSLLFFLSFHLSIYLLIFYLFLDSPSKRSLRFHLVRVSEAYYTKPCARYT